MMRRKIRRTVLWLLAVTLALSSLGGGITLAVDNTMTVSDFYSENDINFYDPNACDVNDIGINDIGAVGSTVTVAAGSDNAETIFKFLTSNNFAGNGNRPLNAVQAAAILGNIQQESNFNPSPGADTGSYKGIVQWGPGRYSGIAEPRTDLNNQIIHIRTEMDGPYKNALGELWSATSEADLAKATFAVTRNYEVAILNGGGPTNWVDDATATKYTQDWGKRKTYAEQNYARFQGMAPAGGSVSTATGSACFGGGIQNTTAVTAAAGDIANTASQMAQWGGTYLLGGGHSTLADLQSRINAKFTGGNAYAIDCSGFVRAVIYVATGHDVGSFSTANMIAHQNQYLQEIPKDQAEAGDIFYWNLTVGHTGIIVSRDRANGTFTVAHSAPPNTKVNSVPESQVQRVFRYVGPVSTGEIT